MNNNKNEKMNNVTIESRRFVKFENIEGKRNHVSNEFEELDNSVIRNGKTMVRMNTEDKLNKATANLLLKLTQLTNEELEQAVTDMMRQIQVLPDNERMIYTNYYLNMFDIVRELRKNGFTA